MFAFLISWAMYGSIGLGCVTAFIYYLKLRASMPLPLPPRGAVFLPADTPDSSRTVRNFQSGDELRRTYSPSVQNMWENFLRGLSLNEHGPCLGTRPLEGGRFTFQTYAEVHARAVAFGSGLQRLFSTSLPRNRHIGVWSKNRPEWALAELACYAYDFILVPLYDTLGTEAMSHIIALCDLQLICCTPDLLDRIFTDRALFPSLSHLVLFSPTPPSPSDLARAASLSLTIHPFASLESLGTTYPSPPSPGPSTSPCTIVFTSGTTGTPKGALISHTNFLSMLAGVFTNTPTHWHPTDVHISYLPLAHAFERIVLATVLASGASVGFYRGDVRQHLFDDIKELRPTVFVSVPRLFNRLYDVAMKRFRELKGVRKWMLERAWSAKRAGLRENRVVHPLWDAVVFGKAKALLGGRVKLMVTGSAPLRSEVKEFLYICFSVDLVEGYGQTECTAACTANFAMDTSLGHVGYPLVCSEVKLVSVPEMDYAVTDVPPRGEVCVRGFNVMSGYYKEEEKTRETIDERGWLHTGDIGVLYEDGKFAIIDRKKAMAKNSLGEYIAPERLENVFAESTFVMQMFVEVHSEFAFIVAVVVPDQEAAVAWAQAQGVPEGERAIEVLCKRKDFAEVILNDLQEIGKRKKLFGFELPRAVYLEPEPFSPENGKLTPSFKLRREVVRKIYYKQVEEMYANAGNGAGGM